MIPIGSTGIFTNFSNQRLIVLVVLRRLNITLNSFIIGACTVPEDAFNIHLAGLLITSAISHHANQWVINV
jgi:hypothetical protein